MDVDQIRLTDACASVFLYLTTFRRNSATSTETIEGLQLRLRREIDEVRTECERSRRLHPLFERAFPALVATVDQVILGSSWPQRPTWSLQLLETHYFGTSEGGRTVYRFANEILEDPSEEASEIAELLFLCMGLGFQGELIGERRELERRRRQLYEKARLASGMGETLTPEAYGRNGSAAVISLPTLGTMRLAAVGAVALIFALLMTRGVTKATIQQFQSRASKLEADLDRLPAFTGDLPQPPADVDDGEGPSNPNDASTEDAADPTKEEDQ